MSDTSDSSPERSRPRPDHESDRNARKHDHEATKQSKSSIGMRLKAGWAKLGLDVPTLMVMAKGATAPTIALAALQSDAYAAEYTTLGYLVAIVSILSFAIMPRAKFVETMTYLLLSTCIASAIAVLAVYCAVHARLNTASSTAAAGTNGTPTSGSTIAPYNSSASAVAAIWLFVEIYAINSIRARYPQFTIPAIVACIFAVVSMTYAPQFPNMTAGYSFVRRLLLAFLTGLGLGTGVAFVIFPVTSRDVVFKEITAYVNILRDTMTANRDYIASLQYDDMFTRTPTGGHDRPRSTEAQNVKTTIQRLTQLHGKLGIDVTLAKREIVWGRLGPDDIQELFRRLRELMLPVIGLSSVVDVFERVTEENNWSRPPSPSHDPDAQASLEARSTAVAQWNKLSGLLQEPFRRILGDVDAGLTHVLLVLQLIPGPKKGKGVGDAEQGQDQPGQPRFTAHLKARLEEFERGKKTLLQDYAKLQGIDLPPDFFNHTKDAAFDANERFKDYSSSTKHWRHRRQLYLVLFMDFLVASIATHVADFCAYVDDKQASGKLAKKHLVVPGYKRTRKWIRDSMSRSQDSYTDQQTGMNGEGNRTANIYLGDAYNKNRDPEHLPPTTAWEKIGDQLRRIPQALRSPSSMFGLRVALATMCIAIIGYLEDSQQFYTRQRIFWSGIMVTISMTPSAGQSIFSFALRVSGTFMAMISSYIIWYIVDGHTAGVLVFFFLFSQIGFYISYKYPAYAPVGMIYSVTNCLIIGYGLQAKKLGVQVSESNGEAYYETYLLAPYRLAAVLGGLFVAWIWTIFPWPISEHSELRNDLGAALYLLGNYYSVVQETVRIRVMGINAIDTKDKNSPYSQLEKVRLKVFAKSMLCIQSLRNHANFLKFDFALGGKFPKKTYGKIIDRVQDIMNFSSLISYSSRTFAEMHDRSKEHGRSDSEWLSDFRRLTTEVHETSQEITTLLVLLSASVLRGQALPPFLKAPETFQLTRKLDAMDRDILSVRHIAEPGYSAFAVMQVASRCISDDLKALLRDVKELVGELDFSFHVPGAGDSTFALSGYSPSNEAVDDKRKGE